MANVVWKGDYICAACGHRAAAEITGTQGIDYSDQAKVDRLVKFVTGNAPCPKCGATDPAARAAARKTILAMVAGYIVAAIIGTFVVRLILGPMAAGIVSVIAFFVLIFIVIKNLGTSGTAKKHIRFV